MIQAPREPALVRIHLGRGPVTLELRDGYRVERLLVLGLCHLDLGRAQLDVLARREKVLVLQVGLLHRGKHRPLELCRHLGELLRPGNQG